ncbi:hypothetical protein [Kitasatospora mediocidica]|uniref:hypothetical protein n=1 Tax=Kitasatospora mediocidica TaxID=58352 RepID=UPI00056B2014|nr:hypothetical protein [Kitasatospora mediocidica]
MPADPNDAQTCMNYESTCDANLSGPFDNFWLLAGEVSLDSLITATRWYTAFTEEYNSVLDQMAVDPFSAANQLPDLYGARKRMQDEVIVIHQNIALIENEIKETIGLF